MSESKFTPGPWEWSREWKEDKHHSGYNGSMGCLEPGVLWFGMDGEEGIYCPNKQDAQLIAAAPSLLEALKAVWPYIDLQYTSPTLIMAEAAINKAEGRE